MQSVFMQAAPGHTGNSLKSYRQFIQYLGFLLELKLKKRRNLDKLKGQHQDFLYNTNTYLHGVCLVDRSAEMEH